MQMLQDIALLGVQLGETNASAERVQEDLKNLGWHLDEYRSHSAHRKDRAKLSEFGDRLKRQQRLLLLESQEIALRQERLQGEIAEQIKEFEILR